MTAWELGFGVAAALLGSVSLVLGIRLEHWKAVALERDARLYLASRPKSALFRNARLGSQRYVHRSNDFRPAHAAQAPERLRPVLRPPDDERGGTRWTVTG